MTETIFSLDGEEITPGTEEGGNGTEEGGETMPSGEPESRLNDGEEGEETAGGEDA